MNKLLLVIMLMPSITLAQESTQKKLDIACETARQKALKPRKKEIYQECITKFKKPKKECKAQADAYNGNRINGAPMFYELPSCEKAFEYRKKHSKG